MARFRKTILIIALSAIAALSPTHSREVLDVPATARWKHAATGIILNPVMAGLNRTEMAVTAPMELDVQARYENAGGSTFATIYIFRPGAGDLALWFDRANASLAASDVWSLESTLESGPVALPTGDVTGALQAIYATGGGRVRSTAVLLVPVGDWIAKIRLSSQIEDAAALRSMLSAFARQITWPETTRTAPAASPVQACATPLAFGKSARPAPVSSDTRLGNALLGAILSSMDPAEIEAEPVAPRPWCRDSVVGTHAVYRQEEDETDRYLLALSDAGRAIAVHPAHGLLDGSEKGRKTFSLSLHQVDRTYHYRDYDRLIPPSQALKIIEKESAISSVSTIGKDKSITLEAGR